MHKSNFHIISKSNYFITKNRFLVMKTLTIISLFAFSLALNGCSKTENDISPTGTTSANSKAKYKYSFDIAGAQYGNLNFSFAKDGSQLERYDGITEKDNTYNVTYSHLWLIDMPTSAKTIDDFVSMTIYTEKLEKGTYDIDYLGKGIGFTAITVRLGKQDNDTWVCYKGKVIVTDVNKIGEPIAGTFEGDFYQATSQNTITLKNGVFSVERKEVF